jgi:hypothetical protein
MMVKRGVSLADQGEGRPALLWLARALEVCPAEDADLRETVRAGQFDRAERRLREALPLSARVDRLVFQLLRREAEAAMGAPPPSPIHPTQP